MRDLKAQSKGRQAPRCELPKGHSCSGGWHTRWANGWKVAYERCAAPREHLERIFEAQTFEGFEAGREDAALAAVRSFAAGEVRKVLLVAPASELSGLIPKVTTGCGKTHLLRAARAELESAGKWVNLVDCQQWREARWSDEGSPVRDSWVRCDVLLVDHLGREMDSDKGLARQLAAVLDQRGDKALAVASDLCRGELVRRYGEAFASRLYGGALVPALEGKDYRAR
jgi:chromosomal replication initiation ATPase DnaA